jgi:hypothetical protein
VSLSFSLGGLRALVSVRVGLSRSATVNVRFVSTGCVASSVANESVGRRVGFGGSIRRGEVIGRRRLLDSAGVDVVGLRATGALEGSGMGCRGNLRWSRATRRRGRQGGDLGLGLLRRHTRATAT